jgi:hypothetical protein
MHDLTAGRHLSPLSSITHSLSSDLSNGNQKRSGKSKSLKPYQHAWTTISVSCCSRPYIPIFYTKPICGVARKGLGHYPATLRYHPTFRQSSGSIAAKSISPYIAGIGNAHFHAYINQSPPFTNSKQVSKHNKQVRKASYKWLF